MNPTSYRSERDVERIGDLLIGESHDVLQNHRDPVVRTEVIEKMLQVLGQFVLGRLEVCTRRTDQHPVGIIWQCHRWTTIQFANSIQERIGSDSAQPALDIAGLIVGQPTLHAKQDILNNILSIMMVTGEPVGQPIQKPSVILCDFFPRGDCSDFRQLYQTPIQIRLPGLP